MATACFCGLPCRYCFLASRAMKADALLLILLFLFANESPPFKFSLAYISSFRYRDDGLDEWDDRFFPHGRIYVPYGRDTSVGVPLISCISCFWSLWGGLSFGVCLFYHPLFL